MMKIIYTFLIAVYCATEYFFEKIKNELIDIASKSCTREEKKPKNHQLMSCPCPRRFMMSKILSQPIFNHYPRVKHQLRDAEQPKNILNYENKLKNDYFVAD